MPTLTAGPEILVNTTTAGNQWLYPAIARLADGVYVVAWSDDSGLGGDGSEGAIMAQLLDSNGVKIGAEFLINQSTAGLQYDPKIAVLSDGSFVVTWTDNSGDSDSWAIKARIYDSSGVPIGDEFLVNTKTTSGQWDADVLALSNGGFVVTWSDQTGDSSLYGTRGQLFDSSGAKVGSEFLVNTTEFLYQNASSMAALPGGGFVVTWNDFSHMGGDGDRYSIRAQIYDSEGNRVGGEFLVNTTTQNDQGRPQVATLADGNFVITWMDNSFLGGDSSGWSIRAQIFTADGEPVGSEFAVSQQDLGHQEFQEIIPLSSGGFLIAWQDEFGDGSGYAVKARMFNADGTPAGDEFILSSTTAGDQQWPEVIETPNGFAAVWSDASGANGDSSGYAVMLRIFSFANVIDGTEGDDILYGTPDDDQINGLGGNDTINALAGSDVIAGGDGNDMITGGAGDDTIDGGEGNDTASWYGETGPVSVNLADGIASAPDGNDTLAGVENVFGSESGDSLIGDESANLLAGFGGNDLIVGHGGGDSLDGGYGDDTLIGGAGFDLLDGGDGDDELHGGQDDDLLIGGAGADILNGNVGNDSLSGGTGNDILGGNPGDDTLDGGDGNDSVVGGPGNDNLYGGAGHDFLRGDPADGLSPGDDYIDGGGGFDRATFYNTNNGVTVDLNLQGVAQDTGQGWDTLVNIEAVSGSVFSDVLTGDNYDNWFTFGGAGLDGHTVTADTISGNGGNDLIIAGLGDHVLDGGDDTDTLGFSWGRVEVLGGVNVSLLLQGAPQDTGQGSMTISNFENLSGSGFDDILTGNSGANLLAGNAGSDTLVGGDGNDTLLGDGEVNMSPSNAGPSATFDSLQYAGVDFYDSNGNILFFFEGQDLYDSDGNQLPRTELVDEFGDPYSQFTLNGITYDFYWGIGNPAISDGVVGNDVLDGGKGDDSLNGGGGDDVLTGGAGNDRFVIGEGSGDDRITDFKSKEDVIVFDSSSGVDSFGDLVLTQVGKDVLVSWGSGDSILIEGAKASKLAASDFEFAATALTALSTADSDPPEETAPAYLTLSDLFL